MFDVTREVASKAAQLVREAQSAGGRTLSLGDAIIAGPVFSNLVLVTFNPEALPDRGHGILPRSRLEALTEEGDFLMKRILLLFQP